MKKGINIHFHLLARLLAPTVLKSTVPHPASRIPTLGGTYRLIVTAAIPPYRFVQCIHK